MGLSIAEQHERRDEHREAVKYLASILRINNFYDSKKSDKLNIRDYFEANMRGYTHGKRSYTRLSKHIKLNNGVIPDSILKCKKIKKKVNNKYKSKVSDNFYKSREWRSLRIKALVNQGRKCCLCGRTPKDGIILHVDHIKPRSNYPELELSLSNLQILCEDCNLGKSNHYEEDWR